MIYLNNTATSFPKPPNVIKAIEDFMKKPYLSHGRSGIENDVFDIALEARKNIAKLFNIENPKRIIFTSGSTESLNTAIFGLNLDGKNVVITETEHNSVIRPLKTLEKDGKISLTIVKCDKYGQVNIDDLEKSIVENTALIVVNHSSNVTGAVQEIKKITEIGHRNNSITLVDASQSAGNVEINCKDWNLDIVAFTGHKNLFGLQGIGGFYLSENIKLKPLKYGGTGTKSTYLYQPEEMPAFFEAGTPNMLGILSLYEGTKFILETGFETIKEKKKQLVLKIYEELSKIEKIKLYNNLENNSFSNIAFNIGQMAPEEVNFILDNSYEIVVRSGVHCAPLLLDPLGVAPWGTVRVSPSFFNTEAEIDKFIFAVKEISEYFAK